jgi:hypothetical protein
MRSLVATDAQSDQVFLNIIPEQTSSPDVMRLKV